MSSTNHQSSYATLEKFQSYQERLCSIYDSLLQLLQDDQNCDVFSSALKEEAQKLAKRIKSKNFRLAVAGGFSQGKSTFLNALLGEEIQPVRAIPCSGVLTVIKNGSEKRVVCHYKDGTQAEIPFEEYQQQASIPKAIAIESRDTALAESNIVEIVLEHPELALCRHHVEIVDSPGLNEHPDRTAVTERLLKDADAAIFLTSARQQLTQDERNLLKDLKRDLQKGDCDEPAENLFILVNFMDSLSLPEDIEDVKKRVNSIVSGSDSPLIKGEKRVHFISARMALEAALAKTTNEYSEAFREFVGSLETFLVEERGAFTLRKNITTIRQFSSSIKDGFTRIEDAWEDKLSSSEAEKRERLEKIGEISGINVKIQNLKTTLIEELLVAARDSKNRWKSGLEKRLFEKSTYWSTEHRKRRYKKEISEDYQRQCYEDMYKEWGALQQNVNNIAKRKADKLEAEIAKNLQVIDDYFDRNSSSKRTDLSSANVFPKFDFTSGIMSKEDFMEHLGVIGLVGGIGVAAAVGAAAVAAPVAAPVAPVAGGLFALFAAAPAVVAAPVVVPVVVPVGAAVAAGAGMSVLISELLPVSESTKRKLKTEILQKGIEVLLKNPYRIKEIDKDTKDFFNQKAQDFHRNVVDFSSTLSSEIEQQEKISQKVLAEKKAKFLVIERKALQLKEIEAALDCLAKIALA